MQNLSIKKNSLQAWILASRPKTLSAAAVPVMLGTALACHYVSYANVSWTAALLCLLFAFVMQIDANFVNDYYDYLRGNDDDTRLGPKRACAEGWVSVSAMKAAIVITTLLACLIGLPLVLYGGYKLILVGVACVAFCFLYTTTLSYIAMGDVLVLLCFGVIPVCCTFYVETAQLLGTTMLSLEDAWVDVLLISVACGLVIDTLLIVNNFRDMENDRNAGKKTLAVMLGKQNTLILFLTVVIVAMAIHLVLMPEFNIIAVVVIVLLRHFSNYRQLKIIGEGRELNKVLGATSKLILIYGLLSSISIVLI